jgi:hypothetical protein
VEDVVYLICKLADYSWKRQLDQNTQWFWFQCVRRLSKIMLSYFNFTLDPEVNSTIAKDTMPNKEDKALEDIAGSFQKFCCNIKSAVANGNGRPLTDSAFLHVDGRGLPNKGGTLRQSRAHHAWHH